MTAIEQKALALVNELFAESGGSPIDYAALFGAGDIVTLALCRAIEQHEATKQEFSNFRQEVSDALAAYFGPEGKANLRQFIIPAPKLDPLVEVFAECDDGTWETKAEYADKFRAALESRGLEIRSKANDQ